MPKSIDEVLNHNRGGYRPLWREATAMAVEKEKMMFELMANNKKVLNAIFNEILSVCQSLRETKDIESRKILNHRYMYLQNKYCHSNAIDEKVTYS